MWARYRRPIAITEVHHGCTRDEQLRWLAEVWEAAKAVRAEGADVRAVTLWSLFGTVDWNTLLTEQNGVYEPGVFDVRGPRPRRTALARAAAGLSAEGSFDHPVLDRSGWWKRDARFYRPVKRRHACRGLDRPRQLLIAGAGMLGRALSRIAEHRGLDHALLSRSECDIADAASVAAALACYRPWAVINAAGVARPAPTPTPHVACPRDGAEGADVLARACAEHGFPLVTFSSDLVFDGRLGRPYRESDDPAPACFYGRTKAEAERRVLAAHGGALVVRTGPLFGPWDRSNFLSRALSTLAAGAAVKTSADVVSPTYLPDLAHVVLDLLIDGESGLWHLATPGAIAWPALAREAAQLAGLEPGPVRALGAAPRRNTALTSERGVLLPPLDSALRRFVVDSQIDWTVPESASVAAE